MKYFLAIDIGASSGRGIIGWKENNSLQSEEIYRFENGVKEQNGHLVWDIQNLFVEVKNTIREAFKRYRIESLSIDSWGVDYVLMKETEVLPVYAYRDERTKEIIDEVHRIIPFETLYQRTGCQFQPFNSIYQLYADKKAGRLEGVEDFLMIPEYLLYKLTGVRVKEFTNATTTGMINCQTLQFDEMIIDQLGLNRELFPVLSQPRQLLGHLSAEVEKEVGGNCDVVLCATHDTGSAVEGINMDSNQLYISSGTWSLLGVKTERPITDVNSMRANYSNEGGVGYNRYQKNIMGMWLANELRKELCSDKEMPEIVKLAQQSSFDETVDANADCFLSPKSMKEAFDSSLQNMPESIGDYFRCAYRSLALSYKKAIEELETNTKTRYSKLYIVGGGAKNRYLNDLTEKLTQKEVIALPIEATALGNLKIQMED